MMAMTKSQTQFTTRFCRTWSRRCTGLVSKMKFPVDPTHKTVIIGAYVACTHSTQLHKIFYPKHCASSKHCDDHRRHWFTVLWAGLSHRSLVYLSSYWGMYRFVLSCVNRTSKIPSWIQCAIASQNPTLVFGDFGPKRLKSFQKFAFEQASSSRHSKCVMYAKKILLPTVRNCSIDPKPVWFNLLLAGLIPASGVLTIHARIVSYKLSNE